MGVLALVDLDYDLSAGLVGAAATLLVLALLRNPRGPRP
jgi:hypothetical protein